MPNKSIISFMSVCAAVLVGCAAEPPAKPETQVAQSGQHVHETAPCQDAAQATSIACSKTVTATVDQNGKLWIVWVSQNHIYLQSSDDHGQHFSEPLRVNAEPETIASNGEYRPKIKIDTHANIYLTWTQNLEKRHTGNIRFSRSKDGGHSFSKPITVNDNLDVIGHRFDSLAVGKNGEIFVAWLDARDKEQAKASQQEHLGSSLYYAWSDNGGQSFYPNKVVAPHSCECCRLGTEIDEHNLPVVLWRHVYPGNIRDHAVIKFKDWHTPGEILRVSQENWKIDACPHHGPALSIAENGDYHSVWFSGASDLNGLFYSVSRDGGKTYSQPHRFGQQGAKHPNVLASGQQVVIVWSEFDGNANKVMSIRSADGGQSWSQPDTLASTKASADDAFLVSHNNEFYLSWQTGEGYQFQALAN